MTTNQTPIPEPTSPTSVVMGKRNGETVVAARMDDDDTPWAMQYPDGGFQWTRWPALCHVLTDIRVVCVPEVAAQIDQLKARIAELEADKPEPGPWLHGAELAAVMLTLKADDEVEMGYKGHTATGKLWANDRGCLVLWALPVRTTTGKPGGHVDSLRIIERAPEPETGADTPDEVVEAAGDAINAVDIGRMGHREIRLAFARAAIAAADAKRAELAGGVA